MVRMHEVDSSSIRAIGYDRAGEALWVEYRSSPVRYVYFGVPPDEYRDLEAAESKGGYVNRRIKPRYPYQRRRQPERRGT